MFGTFSGDDLLHDDLHLLPVFLLVRALTMRYGTESSVLLGIYR